ncbi:MAG: hypothetical protein MOGMAGMI_01753 [Candidatus Omnitrophica bacterium]|nr:hypothetical protein [Candidatus Omnitrophota bacterium]
MSSQKKSKLLAASVAGLMAVSTFAALSTPAHAENVPCYGINACKGTGECGGQGHSCHGQNACKGAGWVKVPAEACTKIAGGRLTAEA